MILTPTRHLRDRSTFDRIRSTDGELREVVSAVRIWGLACGHTSPTDALTAVVGLTLESARAGELSPRHWTAERVRSMLDHSLARHSRCVGAAVPAGLDRAVALWLAYLADRGQLDATSDPIDVLLAATADRAGKPAGELVLATRRHPSAAYVAPA
ncbi:MAG: hypothetical protein OEY23_16835 [Acidimicrobiia bacterium]|nr:hypothetical protein [Acidimicrobiia bacterium]